MRFPAYARATGVAAGAIALLVVSARLSCAATFTEVGATLLDSTTNYEARSASLADIDNDGDLDLFFQGTARVLWRNDISSIGKFTNVSATAIPAGLGPSWSAAWGDYDGDGKIDLFVGQSNSGADGDVLRNNGAGGFTNESVATGLTDPGFHQNVAWVDIDNDRDLDLMIGMEGPEKHEIYLQGPASHFTPVGAAVGFQAPYGIKAYGMAIGDPDGDGDMDVYISTCDSTNRRNNYFQNMLKETGSLSFVDIADTNGTQNLTNSYHSEFVDFDNDGKLDLFMTGADGNRSRIWRNMGNNQFTDVDTISGHELLRDLQAIPQTVRGVDFNGAKPVDYDNDGDLDLYFHDNLAGGNQKLFRNDGNWDFRDVTTLEGLTTTAQNGYDSAWGDVDNDGDQDVIDSSGNGFRKRIFTSNVSINGNHWLYVRLKGPTDNTTGIGASLYATTNDGTPQELTLRREANTSAGTFNQSDLPVHFGLGANTTVDMLRIQWPDGSRQNVLNVAVNHYITVPYLPGDYNGDLMVDAADYVLWRDNMNTDGYTQHDYDVWRMNFGTSIPPGAGAIVQSLSSGVPEPSTLVLLSLAFVGYAARRGVRAKS